MLGFWVGLWAIIKALPAIISFIKKIAVMVDTGIDWAQTSIKLAAFTKAYKKAEATGDTSDLEAIFNPPSSD